VAKGTIKAKEDEVDKLRAQYDEEVARGERTRKQVESIM